MKNIIKTNNGISINSQASEFDFTVQGIRYVGQMDNLINNVRNSGLSITYSDQWEQSGKYYTNKPGRYLMAILAQSSDMIEKVKK
ncbi:MAG: hypothetical protein ACRCX2_16705 [Paraclostridium sp.]